ncbi:MAG: hypothetical protein IRZ16_00820 [Myxococcaceae bacterium]|nr:hypothetical protein [Myxococcaceae bacterium]
MTACRPLWVATALAAILASPIAFAQRAIVLQFEGDRRDTLRSQIVREVLDANEVELAALKDFTRAANRKGFKGKKVMTPAAVGAVARDLGVGVAVEGAVGRTFLVRFLDANGTELWSKELPVKRGLISQKNAGRLARALAAAVKAQSSATPPQESPPEESNEETQEEAPPPPEKEAPAGDAATTTLPTLDRSGPAQTPKERERQLSEENRESHTITGEDALRAEEGDQDLEAERGRRRRKRGHVGPRLLRITLGGITTWRSYCSRPGVTSCQAYDALPEDQRPAGDTVNFLAQVPYAGFGLELEFFPMASFDNAANGFGLSGAFSRGFSRTNVRVEPPSGEQPETEVVAIDDSWQILLHYRFHFGYGPERDPLVGYVGLRAGVGGRTFEVDPTARVPLPGSHRRYPAAGLEASVPVLPFFRIEAAGMYFPRLAEGFNWVSPTAGLDELAAYGDKDDATGWMAEGGVAGEVWGPLGYSVKIRLTHFEDHFTGSGNKWSDGGAAEETYTGLFWAVTASF